MELGTSSSTFNLSRNYSVSTTHCFQKGITLSSGSYFLGIFFLTSLIFRDISIAVFSFNSFQFHLKKKMESACPVILNSTSYFQWLPHMVDILRSKGLYRISTWQETKPSNDDKAAKWKNKQDQARGLIGMSIAQDLRFHILDIDTPDKALEKINNVFGIQNQIKAHQL